MARHWILVLFAGLLFISFSVEKTHAHGGHKKPAVEMEEPATGGSIYAVEEDAGDSSEEPDMFRTDSLSEEGQMMEPMDHKKMPHIEIAKREWVSPKQKGYGVAVGITIFAGLIFGVLQFKGPNE